MAQNVTGPLWNSQHMQTLKWLLLLLLLLAAFWLLDWCLANDGDARIFLFYCIHLLGCHCHYSFIIMIIFSYIQSQNWPGFVCLFVSFAFNTTANHIDRTASGLRQRPQSPQFLYCIFHVCFFFFNVAIPHTTPQPNYSTKVPYDRQMAIPPQSARHEQNRTEEYLEPRPISLSSEPARHSGAIFLLLKFVFSIVRIFGVGYSFACHQNFTFPIEFRFFFLFTINTMY